MRPSITRPRSLTLRNVDMVVLVLGSLVGFVASGYSSKDQLCRLVLVCGSIDGCVVVCKSRTCGQQSILSGVRREDTSKQNGKEG
jgi:hypothetical protein